VYGKNNKIIIEADKLDSNMKTKLSAKGNVVLTKNTYKITANEIQYNSEEKTIYLKDRTKLTDSNNNNIFAEEGIISDDMLTGTFKNAGIILNNGISIVSPTIIKENNESYLIHESEYYFCPNENLDINLSYEEILNQIKKEKFQLFSIHSKRSTINKNKNRIYLTHVFIRFLDIPFFYLPYITSSRPFSTRVSGLSAPHFYSTNNYGASVSLPFKFYFFDNLDLIFEPQFYTAGNILFNFQVKYNTKKNIMFDFDLKYAFDRGESKNIKNDNNITEFDDGKYNDNKIYLEFIAKGVLDNNKYFYTNINLTNDNYFIKDYFGDYTETLTSKFSLFKINKNSSVNFEMMAFQEIREKNNFDVLNTPYFIPNISVNYSENVLGGLYFNLKSDVLHIFSEKKDNDYTNFKFYPNLEYNTIFGNVYIKSDVKLLMDTYQLHKKDEYRIIPELELKVFSPFTFFNRISITPKVQYITSNTKNADIPNNDSKDSELTINNLFSNNRYSGYDLIEYGNRINYGIEFSIHTNVGSFDFNIGQGYKDKFDKNNRIANFENTLSDILTGLNYRYNNMSFNYLNNIDYKTYRVNRQEFMFESEFDSFVLNASYVHVNSNNTNILEQEQVNFYLKYNFTSKVSINFEVNDNLKYNRLTLGKIGIVYEDNCFLLQFDIRKQGYIDSKEKDNVSLNLSLRLKNGIL
jgi:LPS-assembly protein